MGIGVGAGAKVGAGAGVRAGIGVGVGKGVCIVVGVGAGIGVGVGITVDDLRKRRKICGVARLRSGRSTENGAGTASEICQCADAARILGPRGFV